MLTSSLMQTSHTVTLKLHEAVAPPESVAVQLTVVVPNENAEPEAGVQTTVAPGQLSTTTGLGNVTIAVVLPGVAAITSWSGGQVITGGGFCATVAAAAELFAGFGSLVVAEIVTTLLITAPFARMQFAVVLNVTVAVAPTASETYVTVRFCPLPPQTPPLSAAQELNSAPTGSGSLKVTLTALLGPLLR